jgi:L-asparaginase
MTDPMRPMTAADSSPGTGVDVTVLATGGTIDKVYSLAGQLEIGPPAASRLLEVMHTDLRIDVESVVAKDSLEITDTDRELLVRRLESVHSEGVVITHGTDTMVQTAEYLHRHSTSTESRVVVLTGAVQPAAMVGSDAALNLGASLLACQILPAGTYICMSGCVFAAGEVRKDSVTGRFVARASATE